MNNIINICNIRKGEKHMDIKETNELSIEKMQEIETNELSIEKMQEIETKVSDILNDFPNFNGAIDIVKIVKKAGFNVETQDLDIGTTGCIFCDDTSPKKTKLILVNTEFSNPDNEKDVVFKKSRFITAHEFGHFILHKSLDQPLYAHRDTEHRTDPEEIEADYFATAMLMPLQEFKTMYKFISDFSKNDEQFIIETLSRLFRVTRKKVKKRISDISLLEG